MWLQRYMCECVFVDACAHMEICNSMKHTDRLLLVAHVLVCMVICVLVCVILCVCMRIGNNFFYILFKDSVRIAHKALCAADDRAVCIQLFHIEKRLYLHSINKRWKHNRTHQKSKMFPCLLPSFVFGFFLFISAATRRRENCIFLPISDRNSSVHRMNQKMKRWTEKRIYLKAIIATHKPFYVSAFAASVWCVCMCIVCARSSVRNARTVTVRVVYSQSSYIFSSLRLCTKHSCFMIFICILFVYIDFFCFVRLLYSEHIFFFLSVVVVFHFSCHILQSMLCVFCVFCCCFCRCCRIYYVSLCNSRFFFGWQRSADDFTVSNLIYECEYEFVSIPIALQLQKRRGEIANIRREKLPAEYICAYTYTTQYTHINILFFLLMFGFFARCFFLSLHFCGASFFSVRVSK